MGKVNVGIEAINYYGGSAYVNVKKLAELRNLDNNRFENLLMKEKSVPLNYEDPISFGVNAAKPIIDSLSDDDKDRIEMLVTCTESGIDFGKSISTYIHHYLGLNRNCRLFELKNACFSGSAGYQNALNFVASQVAPGAKALVIATDMIKFAAADGGEALTADWSFAELSGGAGAVAILVSEQPDILVSDFGANGSYGYEIMDTCRPITNGEAGNADLSLMSYLDCCEAAFKEYCKRVADVDYVKTFDYLVFHTPFGGMVKGAHRTMMRKLYKAKPAVIAEDFDKRVFPGMQYCMRVGNSCGATIFLNLISTICHGDFTEPKRLGFFSYGSGCCSEFYSGVVTKEGQKKLLKMDVNKTLDDRYELSMDQYELILRNNGSVEFGTRNADIDFNLVPEPFEKLKGKGILVLNKINEYHREYIWV